jgi:hypothetical protein
MKTRIRKPVVREHVETVTPRGADEEELAFLGSRAESTPLSEATIKATLAQLADEVRRAASSAGVEAHAHGTTLITLYKRHADTVLGYPSFRALLVAEWPDDISQAYRAIRIARGCTVEQSRLGVNKCDLGLRLVSRVGLKSFGQLVDPKRPYMLKLPDDLEVSFADASVRQIRAALGLIETPPPADEDERELLAKVRREIAVLVERSPEYLELAPAVGLRDGKLEIRSNALGVEGLIRSAEFQKQLAKKLGASARGR